MNFATDADLNENCPCLRCNTVCCDFSFMKRNLTVEEQQLFVALNLRIQHSNLKRLQWNSRQRCMYLRLTNAAMVRNLLRYHNKRHVYPPGPQGGRVELTMLEPPQDVILFDLSEMVTDEQVRKRLDRYGIVLKMGQAHWVGNVMYAGVASGHRIVRMIVRKTIPRNLRIGSEVASIIYPNQHRQQPSTGRQMPRAALAVWRRVRRTVRRS